MKRSRFNEEQIIGILKGHKAALGAKQLCRKRYPQIGGHDSVGKA